MRCAAEIKALVEQQRATEGERSDAERALRQKETEVAAVARDVHDLDVKIEAQQADLDALDAKRAKLETALKTQRDALAALLRSAYALGRDEELKLLLQQNDVAAIARVLAYNRYFQRARIGRIDALSVDLESLAKVQESIREKTAELATTRDARAAEGARLDKERSERETLVAELDTQAQGARRARRRTRQGRKGARRIARKTPRRVRGYPQATLGRRAVRVDARTSRLAARRQDRHRVRRRR